jgi:phospho-N-acetylmuramoyl-pentapeptide-transferase
MTIDIVKVILPAVLSFGIGILITPFLTHFLYKHKLWKKRPGKQAAFGGGTTPVFNRLHREKETGTPRMGGVVIWMSASITIVGIWLLAILFPNDVFEKIDFLSRDQTWIPLFTLLVGALVGLVDDLLEVRGNGNYQAGGLSLKHRLLVVSAIALFVGWWLHVKLDITALGIPFYGDFTVGVLLVPIFVLVAIALYASGVIDGIDGLSGGVFASIFMAYAAIAFNQDQINLAAFSAMLSGSILAFLWFNIPPARFYMTETGTMGLTLTLAVVAFMTDSLGGGEGVAVLPIIAFPLVITVASNVLQIVSKKIWGKKIFHIAPLHHHFEAIGWPGPKVAMRYWILSIIFAIIGLVVAFVG